MANSLLEISDLTASIDSHKIINDLSLEIKRGEIHLLAGHNGSGKSTLGLCLLGADSVQIQSGSIKFEGNDISSLSTEERVKKGLFVCSQNPVSIPGVTIIELLRCMASNIGVGFGEIYRDALKFSQLIGLDIKHLNKNINKGMSGGEKKKLEFLQALLLKPKFIFVDEIDSGLDAVSTKLIFSALKNFSGKQIGVLIISHRPEIVKMIDINMVHTISGGKIISSKQIPVNGHEKPKGLFHA